MRPQLVKLPAARSRRRAVYFLAIEVTDVAALVLRIAKAMFEQQITDHWVNLVGPRPTWRKHLTPEGKVRWQEMATAALLAAGAPKKLFKK